MVFINYHVGKNPKIFSFNGHPICPMLNYSQRKGQNHYPRHAETGGGGLPSFVAKLFKLIKLKVKVVNILKVLTSDLYDCIEDA